MGLGLGEWGLTLPLDDGVVVEPHRVEVGLRLGDLEACHLPELRALHAACRDAQGSKRVRTSHL